MLLNRRYPGELQRLHLHTYKTVASNQNSQNYEEFSEALSETEKLLLNYFKRIVFRDKRGRGVPGLITNDVQEHSDIILKHRNNVMKKFNNYFLGNPKTDAIIFG